MYSKALSFVYTKDDYDQLENAISELNDAIFKKRGEVEGVLNNITPPGLSGALKELLDTKEAVEGKDEVLKGLKKELKSLVSFKITFSKTPSYKLLKGVADWVKRNIENVFIEYDIDPTIVGGIHISYKGEFRDFSIGEKLEEYLTKNKEEILNKLKAND